jgi:hypothetical protein
MTLEGIAGGRGGDCVLKITWGCLGGFVAGAGVARWLRRELLRLEED